MWTLECIVVIIKQPNVHMLWWLSEHNFVAISSRNASELSFYIIIVARVSRINKKIFLQLDDFRYNTI